MKKTIILFLSLPIMLACSNNTEKPKEAPVSNTPATPGSENKDYDKGLALIGKSDCLTCHKVDEKLIGPPYREVAKKYASLPHAVDTLAAKVVRGGSGNWGAVPMAAHPQINMDDAKQMVKYILLLNN